MDDLLRADPGTPDTRSAVRFMWWHLRRQSWRLAVGVALSSAATAGTAVSPALIGRAIDALVSHHGRRFTDWLLALVATGLAVTGTSLLGRRNSQRRWLDAAYSTIQLVVRQATGLGHQMSGRIAAGELMSVGTSDAAQFGFFLDAAGRLGASIVSLVVAGAIVLSISRLFGLLILLGCPVLFLVTLPLFGPLHRVQARQRAAMARMVACGTDVIEGLRVLRGTGGEDAMEDAYRVASQEVRRYGVAVGLRQAFIDGMSAFATGLFVALLAWLGARAVRSHTMNVGDLIACYSYAVFLVGPLQTAFEAVNRFTRAHVAARKTVSLLGLEPAPGPPDGTGSRPAVGPLGLTDARSGLDAPAGRLTGVVTGSTDAAVLLADRLGGYSHDATDTVAVGGVPLREMATEAVRDLVFVSSLDATLFRGPLRQQLDPHGRHTEREIFAAVHAACADDVVDALPDGLDAEIEENGWSLSGGQRQRLMLARALLTDSPVLILVEPTSAVDAYTEAQIAQRISEARQGQTTVAVSSSAVLLSAADQVVVLIGGTVAAAGPHERMMAQDARYRALIDRDASMTAHVRGESS